MEIQVIFSTFRVEIKINEAFWRSAVTLDNIEYCTEYNLEIRMTGETQGRRKEISIKQGNITKQEPSKYVTPKIGIYEGYTNLTCSAR